MVERALSPGRIVYFVVSPSEIRPAIVGQVWNPTCCNLSVFVNPYTDGEGPVMYRTSVTYDAACGPGTWHWPERKG